MSQSDDMDAINRFMLSQQPKTSAATKLKDEWIAWYESLSYWDKVMTSENYDIARNKRNAYDLANATSAQEKANVQQVIKTGLTTEQTASKTAAQTPGVVDLQQYDRRTSTGAIYVQPGPIIPTEYKVGALVVGGLAVVAFAYNAPTAIAGAFSGRRPISEKLAKLRRRIGRRISGHS